MPTTVNKHVSGPNGVAVALKTLQTYTAQSVKITVDDQMRAAEIIKLQTYLSTVSATNPPSNKKFDPAKINKYIDDQMLAAKLIELQIAADIA